MPSHYKFIASSLITAALATAAFAQSAPMSGGMPMAHASSNMSHGSPSPQASQHDKVAIKQAIEWLTDTRHALMSTAPDKDGRREKAVGLVDEALNQVRAEQGVAEGKGY